MKTATKTTRVPERASFLEGHVTFFNSVFTSLKNCFADSNFSLMASKLKNYSLWQRDFITWLMNTQKIELFYSPSLGEYSKPNETEGDFKVRLQLNFREERDKFSDKLRNKYASRFSRIDERIERAKLVLQKEAAKSKQQKNEIASSIGSLVYHQIFGGRRNSSVMKSISRSRKQAGDVKSAEAQLQLLQKQRLELDKQFQSEINDWEKKTSPLTENLERAWISPIKNDIVVRLVALTWILPNQF